MLQIVQLCIIILFVSSMCVAKGMLENNETTQSDMMFTMLRNHITHQYSDDLPESILTNNTEDVELPQQRSMFDIFVSLYFPLFISLPLFSSLHLSLFFSFSIPFIFFYSTSLSLYHISSPLSSILSFCISHSLSSSPLYSLC